jgi:hypothetical protein
MNDYSDDQQDKNQDQVENWWNEFAETQHFSGLSEAEKDHASFIISAFTDYMFGYEDQTPDNWSVSGMRSVCLEILPRKVTAEEDCFEAIAPVLGCFFRFLAEKDYQRQAGKLAENVITLKSKILVAAKNPSNWGMAKSLAMMAERAGFDISDPTQSEAFISRYNEQVSTGLITPQFTGGFPVDRSVNAQRAAEDRKKKRKAQRDARKKSRR